MRERGGVITGGSCRTGSLEHRSRVADVVSEAGISAPAGVIRVETRTFAVGVKGAWVLRVYKPRILLAHELLHDGEHVDLAFIDEHFGVFLIGFLHADVAEMHV